MAMNKAEKQNLADAILARDLAVAFRFSPKVEPDLKGNIEFNGERKGWCFNSYTQKVSQAISWQCFHYQGDRAHERTSSDKGSRSQNRLEMYSTRGLALQALRGDMVADFAEQLRRVDVDIANELKRCE